MLRSIIYISLVGMTAFSASKAWGQTNFTQKWEFGITAGVSNYVGDIRPARENYFKEINPAFGVFSRINFNPRISLKSSLNFGAFSGQDQWSDNDFEVARNLSFRNYVFDVATQIEFNFFRFILGTDKYNFSPYLFAGVGAFYHNPQANLDGTWYALQPLGTEGQNFPDYSNRDPYSLLQVSVPFGGGLKYCLNKKLSVGVEVGYRNTFTDYLDDISTEYVDNSLIASGPNGQIAAALADRSGEVVEKPIGEEFRQRGNEQSTDAYFFSVISISYTFRKFVCPSPSNIGF